MLKLKDISRKLGHFNLSDINLEIPEGEYFVLLGRSGSGKTQLLELIAGLNNPDKGEIWIDEKNVTFRKIQERNVGMVFQDYAIFPNMTVFGNIAYSLHSRKMDKKSIDLKVYAMAEDLNIAHLLNRFTNNLSGGELQRVALARTLITAPKVLLLDEPMASIDASLKDDIKSTFRHLNKKGLTIVHVTHDYGEAVSLASMVGVIHNGRIIQVGTPDEVFLNPVNKFVARYAGIRNFFRVRYSLEGGKWIARCDGNIIFNLADNAYPEDGLIIIPNDALQIHTSEPTASYDNCFRGIVRDIIPTGSGMEIIVDSGEMFYLNIPVNEYKRKKINELSEVWITFPREAGIALQGSM